MNGDESSDGQGVVPLRTILINFLNLVETYEARRNGGSDSYDSEFQELKQFSESLKNDPDYVCKEGEKNVNRKKNRYKDILPFDYTRVILSDYGDVPGSDYINANFIKGASGSSAYIASQGPLPHTVNDFWRMVVECEVQVIVMACNEQESGKHKCENYWVEEDTQEREFGEVIVWLKKCRQVCPDFLVRTMRIRFTNSRGEKEERNVCQFHYSAWPDHGVPTKVRPLLDMVRLIRDRQTSETLPVLVHCSAGCGRTGTICAIDYVWGLLRLGRLTKDFSLFTLVREMRKQRIAMVQTKDQYILVHRAVKELFQEQLKIIDSHPYANVDQDGLPFDLKKELQEPTYEMLDFTKGLHPNSTAGRPKDYQDISGNINNNNLITVSVSNVNVNPKSSPPPLPPPSLGPKTSPPVSSLSSSGETTSSLTPPSTVDKTDGKKSIEKNRTSDSSKVHTGKSSRPTASGGSSGEKVLEKKNSSSSDSDTPKSSSSNIRSALLRKPSISKLKSFFERNPNKEEKKPGQLSRAKSDVSTRFYNFTPFGQSRNNDKAGVTSDSKGSSDDGSKKAKESSSTPSSSSLSSNPKKPPVSAKPSIPIKRSKSFKIQPQESSVATPLVPVNHVPKSRKKSEDSNAASSVSASTTPSSSSFNFSSSSSSSPIKVCVKQVEIPKLQTVVSKSVKPEMQTATSKAHEYDYDIDDRSHLCQKPISSSLLQREALQKSSKASDEAESSSVDRGKVTSAADNQFGSTSNGVFVKPQPPSRIHILKGRDYANVGFTKGVLRKPREMEDILNRSDSANHVKYEKIKKCDTVNPRILAASMGLAPKHERTSLTRSQSHVWQADHKTQIPIRIFSDENIHQNSSSPTPKSAFLDTQLRTAPTNNEPLKPSDGSEIFIQAIHPEVKSVSSSEYHQNNKVQEPLAGKGTPATPVNTKIVQRRRVPKTNPYANYPACITGSNTNFPYKLTQPVEDVDSFTVNHNESHPHHRASGVTNIPTLRPSHTGGGGSVGNSSDSSSNTGTPRNSSPGTPTQSVDVIYPKLFRSGRSTSTTPQHSNDSSISRSNGISGSSSGGSQPKSILKESPVSTPSEPEEKLLDGSKIFPSTPSNLPKINTIRIAVGVRERRNSFRQAVWKEAQPASPSENNAAAMEQPPQQQASDNPNQAYLDQSNCSNPFGGKSYVTNTQDSSKTHKNYEPIWPDPNSSISNNASNFLSDTNPFNSSFGTEKRTAAVSSSNTYLNFATAHLPTSQFTDAPTSNGLQQASYQNKVEEIKVMLAELNAPRGNGEEATSSGAKKELRAEGSITTLKPQRSLRASSRTQYQQQGLSCFAFRKPSSYESIVDQLQTEEGSVGPSMKHPSSQLHNGRPLNDYVTLGQCRTADKANISGLTNGYINRNSCSPEFAKNLPAEPRYYQESPCTTPVPPPRTRKNHYNQPNPENSFSDYNNLNGGNGSWPVPSTSNYRRIPDDSPATAAATGNYNRRPSDTRDELANSSEVNQNGKTLSSSTSPKAIIRALGLFQAKAANVRSRLANWGESRGERVGCNSNKRTLENDTGSNSDSRNIDNQPSHSRAHEPLTAPFLQPGNSQLASTGLVQRSKHQYL